MAQFDSLMLDLRGFLVSYIRPKMVVMSVERYMEAVAVFYLVYGPEGFPLPFIRLRMVVKVDGRLMGDSCTPINKSSLAVLCPTRAHEAFQFPAYGPGRSS